MNTNKIMFTWLTLKDEDKTKTINSKNRNMGLSCASFLLKQDTAIWLYWWTARTASTQQLVFWEKINNSIYKLYMRTQPIPCLLCGELDDFFLPVKCYLKIWRKLFSLPQFAGGMWVKAFSTDFSTICPTCPWTSFKSSVAGGASDAVAINLWLLKFLSTVSSWQTDTH